MQRGPGFYISTAFYIIILLAVRYLWMPYAGPQTMEWPFHFVRWVFYAIAIGAANLYFYMALTSFRMTFIPCFLIPMGLRIGLDALIWLCSKYLWAYSYSVRYALDALFIVLAGLSITSVDRERKGWKHEKASPAFRIGLAVLSACLLALIAMVQINVLRITHKYAMDSKSYVESILYTAMMPYVLSLAVSFFMQFGMVLWFVDKKQCVRLRSKSYLGSIMLFIALGLLVRLRGFVYPAYLPSSIHELNSGDLASDGKEADSDFHVKTNYMERKRLGKSFKEFDEAWSKSSQIYGKDHASSIQFTSSEPWYVYDLKVNGEKVTYYSPYALFYYDGKDQRLVLYSELKNQPEDAMLTEVLKQGIISRDLNCFEHGCAYLLKYAPDFIKPYIERYAIGEFTYGERQGMRDIRPEYMQEVARRYLK